MKNAADIPNFIFNIEKKLDEIIGSSLFHVGKPKFSLPAMKYIMVAFKERKTYEFYFVS